jgi:hypothetical protein
MSVKRDLFLMTPGDFRTHGSKIHKRDRPAMEITDVRVPYDQNARRQRMLPVHKLVCNVLMQRTEFRSRI